MNKRENGEQKLCRKLVSLKKSMNDNGIRE